jgi:uncharacterized protein
MPRPKCCRRVRAEPTCKVFKPAGAPAASLEEIALSLDEYEAICLADMEGLYHEHAAERMGVSRATFGRIIGSARRKVARVLVGGFSLRIEGEQAQVPAAQALHCLQCDHAWNNPQGQGASDRCPSCGSDSLHTIQGTQGGCPRTRCRRAPSQD